MSYKCQNRPHPCLIFDSDSDCIFLTLTCLCKQLEPGTLCCCPAGSVGLGCQISTSKFLRATQSSCLPCRCSASGSVTAARHNGSRGKSQEAELGRSRGILCMPRGKLRHSQGDLALHGRSWLQRGSPVPPRSHLALHRVKCHENGNLWMVFAQVQVRRDGSKSWHLPHLSLQCVPPPAELWINLTEILHKPSCCSGTAPLPAGHTAAWYLKISRSLQHGSSFHSSNANEDLQGTI